MAIDMTETPKGNEETAERWWKTTLANIVGAIILLVSLGYFVYTRNNEGVMMLVGAAVGWFYGKTVGQQGQ